MYALLALAALASSRAASSEDELREADICGLRCVANCMEREGLEEPEECRDQCESYFTNSLCATDDWECWKRCGDLDLPPGEDVDVPRRIKLKHLEGSSEVRWSRVYSAIFYQVRVTDAATNELIRDTLTTEKFLDVSLRELCSGGRVAVVAVSEEGVSAPSDPVLLPDGPAFRRDRQRMIRGSPRVEWRREALVGEDGEELEKHSLRAVLNLQPPLWPHGDLEIATDYQTHDCKRSTKDWPSQDATTRGGLRRLEAVFVLPASLLQNECKITFHINRLRSTRCNKLSEDYYKLSSTFEATPDTVEIPEDQRDEALKRPLKVHQSGSEADSAEARAQFDAIDEASSAEDLEATEPIRRASKWERIKKDRTPTIYRFNSRRTTTDQDEDKTGQPDCQVKWLRVTPLYESASGEQSVNLSWAIDPSKGNRDARFRQYRVSMGLPDPDRPDAMAEGTHYKRTRNSWMEARKVEEDQSYLVSICALYSGGPVRPRGEPPLQSFVVRADDGGMGSRAKDAPPPPPPPPPADIPPPSDVRVGRSEKAASAGISPVVVVGLAAGLALAVSVLVSLCVVWRCRLPSPKPRPHSHTIAPASRYSLYSSDRKASTSFASPEPLYARPDSQRSPSAADTPPLRHTDSPTSH